MNEWSARRKRIIFLLALFCLMILIGLPLFFFLHKTPNCSDNVQNGDETGIDCGGSCKLICKAESLPMLTKGDARVLSVATSTFEVVASVENPNVRASVLRAGYTFKLFTASSSIPIKTIEGETYIPQGSSFALFEGPFNLVDYIPTRATFEWNPETLIWQKDTSRIPSLSIEGSVLSNPLITPRIDATLHNDSLGKVSNIELVALVSDENGNIVASSKTFVGALDAGGSAPLVFTWPAPFKTATTSIEILPRILPDRSYIK